MPSEINQVFEWAEYLYSGANGTFRSASRKVVRYFLTELILTGESEDEREKMEDLLLKNLHLMRELAEIGDNYMVYGNCFVSIYFPFERMMVCKGGCRTEYHTTVLDWKFNAQKIEFTATCPKCGYRGAFDVQDRRSPEKERMKLINWNPKQMRLRVHPVSGETLYYWEMPARFTERLLAGDRFFVESTPMSILRCLGDEHQRRNEGMFLFQFKKDSIYHMKEASLAGLPIVGWGIPPIMPNFKLAYYIQVLRRYDEAIAMDYIIPFRILYPTVGAQPQQDAVLSSNLAEFRGHMLRMVAERRRDPTSIQVSPFPIGYQMAGGEARMIAPKESIKFAVEELLNSLGYPSELYMGSLTLQTAPVALRLFEKTWGTLVDGYNDLASWIVKRVSRQYMLGEMDASLRSVTLADDLERKALQLQAAAGMDISKSTAYSAFGVKYLDEQKKMIDEQTKIQELQQKAMADQQAQEALQGEGTEGGPGGQAGSTPGDVYEQSRSEAQRLLYGVPETVRRSEMIKMKQSNPTLHALVIQAMQELRQNMQTQGQSQLMQQGQQAVQAGQEPPVSL